MIEITAIRLEAGKTHEHITSLQWRNPQTGVSGQSTRQQIVEWLDESKANQAVVARDGGWQYVGVVHPSAQPPYLRTYADGAWNNNLLALPLF